MISRHTAGHKHHLQQGIAMHQGKGRFFPQRKLGLETRKGGQREQGLLLLFGDQQQLQWQTLGKSFGQRGIPAFNSRRKIGEGCDHRREPHP